jgi:hypothetical protein
VSTNNRVIGTVMDAICGGVRLDRQRKRFRLGMVTAVKVG